MQKRLIIDHQRPLLSHFTERAAKRKELSRLWSTIHLSTDDPLLAKGVEKDNRPLWFGDDAKGVVLTVFERTSNDRCNTLLQRINRKWPDVFYFSGTPGRYAGF